MKSSMGFLTITRFVLLSAVVLWMGSDSWALSVKSQAASVIFFSFEQNSTGISKFKAYRKDHLWIKNGGPEYVLALRDDEARFYVPYQTKVSPTCLNKQIDIPNKDFHIVFNVISKKSIPYYNLKGEPKIGYEYEATFLDDKTCLCEENQSQLLSQGVNTQEKIEMQRKRYEDFCKTRDKKNKGNQGTASNSGQTSSPSENIDTPPTSGGYSLPTSDGDFIRPKAGLTRPGKTNRMGGRK